MKFECDASNIRNAQRILWLNTTELGMMYNHLFIIHGLWKASIKQKHMSLT